MSTMWVVLLLIQMTSRLTSGEVCYNNNTGCAETPQAVNQGSMCKGNGMNMLNDPDNCGRYVMCLDDVIGVAFNCPLNFVPSAKCVPDQGTNMTKKCVPPCTDKKMGCLVSTTANVTKACLQQTWTAVEDPERCGAYYFCTFDGMSYQFQCPNGYRAVGGSDLSEPRCFLDQYSCPVWNNTRVATCTNNQDGCPVSNTLTQIPQCQNFTVGFGIFDDVTCGRFVVCVVNQLGFVFECPVGYRADSRGPGQKCIRDSTCPSPATPRAVIPACTNINMGCPGSQESFSPCSGRNSLTLIDHPTKCGYYMLCLSGNIAVSNRCPPGYHANSAHTPICETDPSCSTPESPRSAPALTRSAGCNNLAYGCATTGNTQPRQECIGRPHSFSQNPLDGCRRYTYCTADGQGVQLECPAGTRAVPTPPQSAGAHCVTDVNSLTCK